MTDDIQALHRELEDGIAAYRDDVASSRAAFRPAPLSQPPAQYDNIYGVEIDIAKAKGDMLVMAFGHLARQPGYNPSKAIGYTDTTDAGYRRIEVYQISGKAN